MVLGTEVCYFSSSRREYPDFSIYNDVNLPVPFHAGDIVTIDCRPFAPVSHAVILEVGDNCDCCCLQALYYAGNGTWDMGRSSMDTFSRMGAPRRFLRSIVWPPSTGSSRRRNACWNR